ncbi:MAG: hypothetical protein KIT56_04670 [Gammaproteobacteria bacterium]|nr:hypothetical protein [Gammaproteobacteria bacterium]MCW5583171.1 hypothetical protein [Gammaproteobacteria bacterium]
MFKEKCGCMKLCPVSLGLALGLACGLGVFLWSIWVMYFGVTPMMAEYHIPVLSLKEGTIHALWAFLKGFVFGFFVALFYDLISCCCKSKWCCKKGCECGSGKDKPEAGK